MTITKKIIIITLVVILIFILIFEAISTIPVAVQIYRAKTDMKRLYYNADYYTEEEARESYPREAGVEYIGLHYTGWNSIETKYNRGIWYSSHDASKTIFIIIPVGTIYKKDSKDVYVWMQSVYDGEKNEGCFDRIRYIYTSDGWVIKSIASLIGI